VTWHYLIADSENSPCSPELVEASSEGISWDGAAFAPSKSKTTLGEYCLPDSETESSRASRSGMTLRRLTGPNGAGELTWYRGDSPVRTYLAPEGVRDSAADAPDYGPRWRESLARYNPDTYSWRTAQCSLLGGLTEFSGTWPRWGMMRDGECFPLPTLAHVTSVRGCFSLPTVTASWAKRGPGLSNNLSNLRMSAACTAFTLAIVQKIGWRWPSELLEVLMLWPEGWTAVGQSATDKFRLWLDSHGKR